MVHIPAMSSINLKATSLPQELRQIKKANVVNGNRASDKGIEITFSSLCQENIVRNLLKQRRELRIASLGTAIPEMWSQFSSRVISDTGSTQPL
jgi:hypothetical protein